MTPVIEDQGGVKWAYFTGVIMRNNQYATISNTSNPGLFVGTVASKNADLLTCLNLCLGDQPRAGGGNCNSVDWWYDTFSCHLSEGTSCEPTVYNSLTGATKPGEAPWGPVSGDYYEKYCICGIADNNPTSNTEIEYNPSLVGTEIYNQDYIFKNDRATECPITSCTLY